MIITVFLDCYMLVLWQFLRVFIFFMSFNSLIIALPFLYLDILPLFSVSFSASCLAHSSFFLSFCVSVFVRSCLLAAVQSSGDIGGSAWTVSALLGSWAFERVSLSFLYVRGFLFEKDFDFVCCVFAVLFLTHLHRNVASDFGLFPHLVVYTFSFGIS